MFRRQTKEDQLITQIETLQNKADMITRIIQLTQIMETDVTPRLQANVNDLEAVGMLCEIIDQFEEMVAFEPNVKNILSPLYDIRAYVYKQNEIEVTL